MKDTATMSKPTPKSKAAPKASSRRKTTAADPTTRKRELDRIAQRNCRERTKNRINFLEEKLRSLEARDRNSQFSNLAAMQETLLNDNSELRAAMRKILFIAESVLNTSKNICRLFFRSIHLLWLGALISKFLLRMELLFDSPLVYIFKSMY